MSSRVTLAVAVVLLLSAVPSAAESLPLTDDEVRVEQAFMVETFRNTCRDLIGPVPPQMQRIARMAEQEFVAANGQEAWDAAMADAREMAEPWRMDESPHFICADTHMAFVNRKIDTGLKGPSFRCSGKLPPSQQAICDGGPIAWGYERAQTRIVAELQAILNDKGKARIAEFLAEGEAYLADCGTRPDCAADSLEWRTRELSAFYVKAAEARRKSP